MAEQKTISYQKHLDALRKEWNVHREHTRDNARRIVVNELRKNKDRAAQALEWFDRLLSPL